MVHLELKVIGVYCHVACDVALHALYFPCVWAASSKEVYGKGDSIAFIWL